MLGERGITLGPSFRGIQRLFRGDNEALVHVALPAGVAPVAPLHPAQLDACFQALGATFSGGGEGGAFLPLAVDQAVLHRPWSGPLWAHARVGPMPARAATWRPATSCLFDEAGEVIAAINGLTIKRVVAGAQADPSERWTYAVDWQAEPAVDPSRAGRDRRRGPRRRRHRRAQGRAGLRRGAGAARRPPTPRARRPR